MGTINRKDKNATAVEAPEKKGVVRKDKNLSSQSLGLEPTKQASKKKGGAGGGAFAQSSHKAAAPKPKAKANTAHKQSSHSSAPAPKAKNTSHMQSSFTFG